ncbi:hypothetical protein JXJ21_21985, partial [candidate division KSB1 bacterium]|nr:hypothetical protein [candidate division KSB1 bacterium]
MKFLLKNDYFLAIAVVLIFGFSTAFAQVGGPYTADDNTVLLLHFDGDLANEATVTEDGVFHGDASNFYFLNNPITELSQCLRIDNDSQNDSAFVTVADADALD